MKECTYTNLNYYMCPTSTVSPSGVRCKFKIMEHCSLKTMDEVYGDSSKHKVCPSCGMCLTCNDCECEK